MKWWQHWQRKKKRADYEENNEDAKARAVKNQKGGKSTNNQNHPANGKKKKPGPCSYCKGLSHTEKQCYYNLPELRKEDWKPHELSFNWLSNGIKKRILWHLNRKRKKKAESKAISFQSHQNDCSFLVEESRASITNAKPSFKDAKHLTIFCEIIHPPTTLVSSGNNAF